MKYVITCKPKTGFTNTALKGKLLDIVKNKAAQVTRKAAQVTGLRKFYQRVKHISKEFRMKWDETKILLKNIT